MTLYQGLPTFHRFYMVHSATKKLVEVRLDGMLTLWGMLFQTSYSLGPLKQFEAMKSAGADTAIPIYPKGTFMAKVSDTMLKPYLEQGYTITTLS